MERNFVLEPFGGSNNLKFMTDNYQMESDIELFGEI